MNFQTITVFEKEGAQVEAEIWATPGWFKFSQCFLYENNPYIAKLDQKINEDGSYIEYFIDYHNEEAYLAWYEEWKHIHDELRVKVIENLKSRGIESKLYWPAVDVPPPKDNPVLPITEFVSKLPTA